MRCSDPGQHRQNHKPALEVTVWASTLRAALGLGKAKCLFSAQSDQLHSCPGVIAEELMPVLQQAEIPLED